MRDVNGDSDLLVLLFLFDGDLLPLSAAGLAYLDLVLVAPQEIDNFQWAIDQDKIRKTGGRQRKKVSIKEKKKDEKI